MPENKPPPNSIRLPRAPFIFNIIAVPHSKTETLRWLVGMRGNVALGILIVLILSLFIPGVTSANAFYLIGINVLFLLPNSIYHYLLNNEPSGRTLNLLKEIMIPMDVLICTMAVYACGGVLSPMYILYSVLILMSIVLLNPRSVYRTAYMSVGMYCILSILEAVHAIPYAQAYWGGLDPHQDATYTTYGIYLIFVSTILMSEAYIGNRIAQMINQRNSQIESQYHDLNTLYNVTSGLGNLMNETEIARYLVSTLKTVQSATFCIVGLINKEGQPEIAASMGLTPDEIANMQSLGYETTGIKNLIERGEPLILEDLDKHPEYRIYTPGLPVNSTYVYPIIVKGRVLGAICLGFERARSMSQEYRNLLTTIASQSGMAIERARLFSDTQRLAREMSTLYDLGLYTGSTLSRSEVIKRTSDNIEKLMNPDVYYIALYDEGTHMITFELSKEYGRMMPKSKLPLDRGGLPARIITNRAPLLVQDWAAEGQQYNNITKKRGDDILSYLAVPMLYDGRVIGVLSVQCNEAYAFNKHDQGLLQAMATQTAMALENANLHQLAQVGATMDGLTRVFNHGHFVELMNRAVADSDKDDSQVSLIMLDIDHFKQYNDAHGHVAGDTVLAMVANALKATVRETDSVGRWGGEEFAVLLPGTGIQEAKKIARSVRRSIAELSPVDGRGKPIASPTVSQGISTYPFPSISTTHLIEEADAALYRSKELGRNQLVVAEAEGVLNPSTTSTPRLGTVTVLKDATITTGDLSD